MDMPEAFEMACVMEREDPRDAWVSAQYPTLMDLPQGAVVGTPSLRRTVLLRALRTDLIEALKPLVHSMSWLAVAAERAVSRAMGGSCSMPLAAHATLSGQVLSLQAAWGNPEGEASLVTAYISGEVNDPQQAEALGDRAAADLKLGGAY
jgi:porphobilinogen deaminase